MSFKIAHIQIKWQFLEMAMKIQSEGVFRFMHSFSQNRLTSEKNSNENFSDITQ